jgi:cytochrome P450
LAFAGHETSASVLSWTFYFLTKNPDWCKEVTKQVREVLKSDKIELVHLEQMPLLKMFIQETMRLRPPAWSFGRYALAEDEIFGEKVYPGDIITISPFLLHHNKDIYPNPKEFNPNRFLPEEVEKRPKATFIPFGLGPRFCVGADLAMIEISMIVACVLRTFDVEASNSTVEMEPLISLRPKGGVELTLTLKEQS